LGPPSLLYNGSRVFPGGKAAGAWCWPPTPFYRRGHERVELYLYPPSKPVQACNGTDLPLCLLSNIYLHQIHIKFNQTTFPRFLPTTSNNWNFIIIHIETQFYLKLSVLLLRTALSQHSQFFSLMSTGLSITIELILCWQPYRTSCISPAHDSPAISSNNFHNSPEFPRWWNNHISPWTSFLSSLLSSSIFGLFSNWRMTVKTRRAGVVKIRYFVVKQPTHALSCTTPLFNIRARTCFGSCLPSSGSFLDSSELLEMQILDHCRNVYKPVYWIKQRYNSVYLLVVFLATSNNARYEH
jgi:hypothetical protein